MSRPLSKVAVAVLIGLIILVGVFVTVQAATASSGDLRGRVDVTAGDAYYLSQQRGVPHGLSSYNTNNYYGGHGCEGKTLDSSDY